MLNPGIFFILLDLPEGEKKKECEEHLVPAYEPPSTLALATMEGLITSGLYKIMTLFSQSSKKNNIGAIVFLECNVDVIFYLYNYLMFRIEIYMHMY